MPHTAPTVTNFRPGAMTSTVEDLIIEAIRRDVDVAVLVIAE